MTNQLYIANLGKYNEGILQGAWFSFPIDMNEVAETIGLNAQYEEWAIHDYEFDFPLSIGEYADVEKLNELVETIEGNSDLTRLSEILQTGDKYDTDIVGSAAYYAFSSLEIDHDIVDDEFINKAMARRIKDGDEYGSIQNFLYNADNTVSYHILDGYGNIQRLSLDYIENTLNEYIEELKSNL